MLLSLGLPAYGSFFFQAPNVSPFNSLKAPDRKSPKKIRTAHIIPKRQNAVCHSRHAKDGRYLHVSSNLVNSCFNLKTWSRCRAESLSIPMKRPQEFFTDRLLSCYKKGSKDSEKVCQKNFQKVILERGPKTDPTNGF